jgi:hypothetical protein
MRKFEIPRNAIQAEASIEIDAPPERAAQIYLDVDKWGQTFPATINRARVVKAGDNWKQIEVDHKTEGHVPNTLTVISANEIGLEENKKLFDASFLNRFEPNGNSRTCYTVKAFVGLNSPYKYFKPFLIGYVRRRALNMVRNYVLKPLKVAAENKLP